MMNERFIPSRSQTVGPYFRICLQKMIDEQAAIYAAEDAIELTGRVIDRDGKPVSDAMLEFWAASRSDQRGSEGNPAIPTNFRRVATDADGRFVLKIDKPGASPVGDARMQAPHFAVLVFARGLLRHLVTRVYFADEEANSADPVLQIVPEGRKKTLIASVGPMARRYEWNIVLQGENETAFFAW